MESEPHLEYVSMLQRVTRITERTILLVTCSIYTMFSDFYVIYSLKSEIRKFIVKFYDEVWSERSH